VNQNRSNGRWQGVFPDFRRVGVYTTVPVLDPGRGKTKTGRLWCYVRDDRPFAGTAPPAALYHYSPDRKGEHPRRHLAGFHGILQADGYAGYAGLYEHGVTEAACMAHCRRPFFELHASTGSPLLAEQQRDLLEIVEDRYGAGSLIITSQVPVDHWYEIVGNPTLADAILDRIVHNAHRIELHGETMRKPRAGG
jgi:hypothetical protein